MISVRNQIENSSNAISQNITSICDSRALLSQNVLSQIRNLVEGVVVLFYTKSLDEEFKYDQIEPGLAFVKSNGKLNFISRFHNLIQKIASHYTLDGDASERLMLKYYEYLFRIRASVHQYCSLHIVPNLESFPVDLDPSLREYHEKIASRIDAMRGFSQAGDKKDRYYIQRIRPFFTRGRIYYEVTFCRAVNKVSKFDRVIAFTDLELSDKYAVNLTLRRNQIEVLGQTMPITLILDWEVSIRSCELKNFSRILGVSITGPTSSNEYRYLMAFLTKGHRNLVDLLDMTDHHYQQLKVAATNSTAVPQIFPVIDEVRRLVRNFHAGGNVLRYLLLRMHNQTLKSQFYREGCGLLSNLNLHYGCIPFDQMPLCTSLPGHNPRFWDLTDCIDMSDRRHELLARRVRTNVESRGVLYSPITEFVDFGDDLKDLIGRYNDLIYRKHREIRKLVLDKRHVFINGYEEDTYRILNKLNEFSSTGVAGYSKSVARWLSESARYIDDSAKSQALMQLFSESRVALIYGAAGTGKSTMVDHIAHYFSDKKKLFLAHTNPAIDNLKRKVMAQNSDFRTVSGEIRSNNAFFPDYDLLVIDECSTVSNSDFLKVIEKTTAKLIVLVGDVYQIESIQFGNWFEVVRSFIPSTSIFELTTPFRTQNSYLLQFWSKVRAIDDDLTEVMARNNYSSVLDASIFQPQGNDEIILCLNYDGLYGINNINRFLQSSNPNEPITWEDSTYKVGDPVLFFDAERFRPIIYNNLKGRIVHIERFVGYIQFDIDLDRPLTELDVIGTELEWVQGSTVRFCVYELRNSDDDDDAFNITVPFQVAYAVSIHKAQGLEYDSVKVVITDANEDDISHSIFYTAITRTRDRLKIFWTPETQQKVIKRLQKINRNKDVALLSSRRGLATVRN
ncbi:AAA family ATPase [Ketobacter sp. MCCC 1A13808]|uniref:ATP-dependent DNA helicase n=1 Tax=Ketobacter sp. MCCC 1A13808 TaxID=2602738 RepID=UPI0012EB96CC|nr:ATP-dependent RecD-like DNA helicase [Ketobacter sp. MCCC 1A13808]MVF12349.1 AAA family ATPase [Ketobacter sp. MCCC 1A13808]